MTAISRAKNQSGFTLIEMAVVVVIVGIVISIMATVLPSLIQSAKISKAKAILEKADYALQGYSMANNRLPFADSDTDGVEDNGDYLGNLPYKTLGLSSGDDVWGNTIKYGVYDDLTATFADADAFCTAISDASLASATPVTTKVYTTSADPCGTADANQAYVIASGGAKDLDGSYGFFDLCNGANTDLDPGFNAPNRIQSTTYDDLVRAFSLNELNYKNCTGGGGGGGGVAGCDNVESIYCGNCDDGKDNDGDTLPDCEDPDCATHPKCVSPTCDIATSSPLEPGNVDSDYSSVTFTTSDGCIGSCEWKLISDDGFTDFYLHPYTGHLSGTLSQCPGTYTIRVGVTDSDSDNNPDPEKDFTIEVTKNLSVDCESGCGQASCDEGIQICYDTGDANKEVEFKIQGGHIEDITWGVDFGTAQGFYYEESGEGNEICTIKRNDATQAGKFTFHVTAKDDCLSNTAEDNFVVQVKVDLPPPLRADAEWRMDECSWDGTDGEVIDSGENYLHGTAKNGADTSDDGKNCRAGSFDGSDDYVLIPDSDELNPLVITILAWVKWSIDPTSGYKKANIISKNGDNQYQLRHNRSNTRFEFGVKTSGGKEYVQGTTTPVQGIWYFVAATYDGSELKLYVDGALENSESHTGNIATSTSDVNIGSRSSNNDRYFEGKIDEVMIFSKALSEDEIDVLYKHTRLSCSFCD